MAVIPSRPSPPRTRSEQRSLGGGHGRRHDRIPEQQSGTLYRGKEKLAALQAQGARERERRAWIPASIFTTITAQSLEDRDLLGSRVMAALYCENVEKWGHWIPPTVFGMPKWMLDARWQRLYSRDMADHGARSEREV